ncbi:MAG: hypothetical protein MUC84_11620 [Solirubrobacteraceae bacterium]|jgi:hypothetical protein|nr:hypothetical protein [Solirubrobacteraceae bacterium]
MRRAGLLSLLTLLALAGAPAAAPAQDDVEGFRTVSGTIACAASGSSLRCDIRKVTGQVPPKPSSCELDWGLFFGVTTTARRGTRLCAGDTVLGVPLAPLYPNRTFRHRSITCRATGRASVRCANRGGHGFALTAARQRLF